MSVGIPFGAPRLIVSLKAKLWVKSGERSGNEPLTHYSSSHLAPRLGVQYGKRILISVVEAKARDEPEST
ncbi:hypothetical protein BDV23DRAFT_165509 [Aspergillus alliaceus]|uniref:Uncharacterized protein n=1 Tax=Petromyces alliaceus TaxID=209559 RepID=A0A5N7BTJ4_PETAA|nr:hypothetical protein BDV23DRAFT_165509 [Aspergillus alliaceus]